MLFPLSKFWAVLSINLEMVPSAIVTAVFYYWSQLQLLNLTLLPNFKNLVKQAHHNLLLCRYNKKFAGGFQGDTAVPLSVNALILHFRHHGSKISSDQNRLEQLMHKWGSQLDTRTPGTTDTAELCDTVEKLETENQQLKTLLTKFTGIFL